MPDLPRETFTSYENTCWNAVQTIPCFPLPPQPLSAILHGSFPHGAGLGGAQEAVTSSGPRIYMQKGSFSSSLDTSLPPCPAFVVGSTWTVSSEMVLEVCRAGSSVEKSCA